MHSLLFMTSIGIWYGSGTDVIVTKIDETNVPISREMLRVVRVNCTAHGDTGALLRRVVVQFTRTTLAVLEIFLWRYLSVHFSSRLFCFLVNNIHV
jgi:hypothetical protein